MKAARCLAAIAVTLLASACSRSPEPSPTPVPTAPMQRATPVAIPVGLQLRSLELGRAIGPDKRVTDSTTSFRPADTIYVTVLTDGSTPATQIHARFVHGAENHLVSESSQTIATSGPAATEFHVAKPDGWPSGAYAVEVSLAGAPPRRAEFKVE